MMGCTVFGVETLARENALNGAVLIAIGVSAGALLVWRERDDPAPLFPVDLLRIRIFGMTAMTA